MTVRLRKPQLPAPAHWIGIRKYWRLLGLPLREALVELRPEHLATHALIIGATGSGKTNLIHHLIAGDLLRGHSIVVLDELGDICGGGLELAARAGVSPDLVRFINLREKRNPLGFNPLKGEGEPFYRALGLIDAIAAESDTWGPQLAEYFRYAALLLAESGGSITQLDGLFHNQAVRRQLIYKAQSESVRAFWVRYDALSADQQSGRASAVLNKVSALLSTEGLRRMLSHPEPIDLKAHLSTPGSILFVSLAVDELHGAGRMVGSLLLNCICREVFSQVNVPESLRNPVRIICR